MFGLLSPATLSLTSLGIQQVSAPACPPGTFGNHCKSNCSKNCMDVCHTKTGHCHCRAPYTGLTCSECHHGWFGTKCMQLCPESCINRSCDTKSGTCKQCLGRRFGNFCEACPTGFYGAICFRKCSPHCVKGTCDVTTGNCPECTDGYVGAQCLDPIPFYQSVWFVLSVLMMICFVIVVSTLAILYLRNRISVSNVYDTSATSTSDTQSTGFNPRRALMYTPLATIMRLWEDLMNPSSMAPMSGGNYGVVPAANLEAGQTTSEKDEGGSQV